jgi:hypothetical protein
MPEPIDGMPPLPDERGDFTIKFDPPEGEYTFIGYTPVSGGAIQIGIWIDYSHLDESQMEEDLTAIALGSTTRTAIKEFNQASNFLDLGSSLSDFDAKDIRGTAFTSVVDAYQYIKSGRLQNIAVIVKEGNFYYVVIVANS